LTSPELSRFVGFPYKSRGRTTAGFDCWGLVCHVYDRQLGIDLLSMVARYDDPKPSEQTQKLVLEEAELWREVEKPAGGDVILWKMGRWWGHVGIIADGGGFFLHVLNEAGSCLQRLEDLKWHRRPRRYYRHRSR